MKKKLMRELVEENINNLLKDKDKVEQIYRKIDETIVMETHKT
jgi:hypothetical protein